MLPEKLFVTKALILHIQNARKEREMSADDLSDAVHKHKGFISAIERKRYKRLSANLLIEIFEKLHDDMSREEIMTKLESLASVPDSAIEDDGDDESHMVGSSSPNYSNKNDDFEKHMFETLLEDTSECFRQYYKKRPNEANVSLYYLFRSMIFDSRFMLFIMRNPFFKFKSLSEEDRAEFIREFVLLFRKYEKLAESRPKPETEKETKTDDSEIPQT